MQYAYIIKGCHDRREPVELIGIFDDEDKAMEALRKADNAKDSMGYHRFCETWLFRQALNETMDFDA